MATPPVFTPGAVLTAAQMNQVGLWLVKTETIGSGVTSVVVSDAFSADFDNYLIQATGGVTSATVTVTMALGGSTTGYYSGATIVTYATGAVTGVAANNAAAWNVGLATTGLINVAVTVMGPNLTDPTTYQSFDSNTTSQARNWVGYHSPATAYTSFTLAGGTFTGGTIRVYGYNPG
jgi:hypothetical protein